MVTAPVSSSPVTFPTPGITMSATSTFNGGTSALGTNFTIIGSPIGGINSRGLRLEQTPVANGGQVVRFTFSKQVRNISFTITDIDNVTNSWSDRIVINTTPFTSSIPSGGKVVGSGTSADPFRSSDTNTNYANSSNLGNVTINIAGPLFFFELQFNCATAASGGQNQLINISPISYCR